MKVIVVTGASSGIGRSICTRLAAAGHKVFGIARRECTDAGFPMYRADVNDTERIKEILSEIALREGKIDVFVNNAGMGIAGAAEFASPEAVQQIFDTNLTSLVRLSALALPYLKTSRGNLINIGSVAGALPIPFQACYSASKAGVMNFSLALDGEVRKLGVKVTVILPGDTKTGFTAARVIESGEDDYGGRAMRSIRRMEKDETSGKSPDSVARAVAKVIKRRRPPLKLTVGGQYKFFVVLGKLLPTRFVNFVLRKMYAE